MKFNQRVLLVALVLCISVTSNANRMQSLEYMRHCGQMNPAECNETLESARGRCITEEEYQTGKLKNRVPWCLNGKKFLSWCACSCFSAGTKLLGKPNEFYDAQWLAFDQAGDKLKAYQIATLSEHGSLSDIQMDFMPLSSWSSGPEVKPLIVIETEDGKRLSVTGGHAMLLASGEMVFAESLLEGQSLVNSNGISVRITSLGSEVATSDVYNVLTSGDTLMSHLIFAEGIVVGDLAWENSLYSEIARVNVRK